MNLAVTLGRASFPIAFGILIGAGAAVIGIKLTHRPPPLALRMPLTAPLAAHPAPAPEPLGVVDVSRSGLEATGGVANLISLIGMQPGEWLISINGGPVTGLADLQAAWDWTATGEYLDLQLRSPGPRQLSMLPPGRRVLVLVHP